MICTTAACIISFLGKYCASGTEGRMPARCNALLTVSCCYSTELNQNDGRVIGLLAI
jgi:hypothetical protein